MVSKESSALRSILGLLDNKEQMEAILDPDSQVIAILEEVCHAVGISYDPMVQIQMVSANKTTDMSLKLAQNILFQLGELTFYLQVHVICDAAYDMLLGQPFDILTQLNVKNFANEHQTITIACPNLGRTVTIPTFA